MSISGKLEDLPLPQLLQVISSSRLTGKLTVTRRQGQGIVLFRDGRIVYAATNSARETVGNLLLMKRRITASALAEALAEQGRAKTDRRLGSILVELGAVEAAEVESVIRDQVERVLREMFAWRNGFVRFRTAHIPDGGEIEVDASDFFLQEGLEPSKVVFDLLSQRIGASEAELDDGSGAPAAEPAPVISLSEVHGASRAPALTGETTLAILDTAGRSLDRGVLFSHSSGELRGVGHFGFDGAGTHDRMRALRIPNDEASVLLEALELRETYRGPLAPCYWNNVLERTLGGGRPEEVVALPVLVAERVILVLYGDNAPSGRPIPTLAELERFLLGAGLEIEQALLDRKMLAFRQTDPPDG